MQTPPTASELAILTILWERGPSSVRQVHKALSADKEVVYTTILKTMQVMLERGFVAREQQGRAHIYRAAVAREQTQDRLLDTFLKRAFGGSPKGLVMRALGNYRSSKEDIAELKALIDRIENEEQ
jgi:predicted transcriptional regulator